MYISSIRIKNYKCFCSTSELQLREGFNVIVGPNNVGKSSLIEALTLRFTARPHRSLATLPRASSSATLNKKSAVEATVVISQDEFLDALKQSQESWLVVSDPTPPPMSGLPANEKAFIYANEALAILSAQQELSLKVQSMSEYGATQASLTAARLPAHGLYEVTHQGSAYFFVGLGVNADGDFNLINHFVAHDTVHEVGLVAAKYALNFIYHFTADRLHVASCPLSGSDILHPTAANLAEVILNLNSHRLYQYNKAVREVLPQIQQVSARHTQNNMAEVFLWMEQPDRDDLRISLTEAGSGIGQVLAMLYLVLNSDHPRVIIIDEPQNFLHPGAVRALINQFKAHPKNQYILVTHSSTVISAARPANVITIERDGVTSDFREIDSVVSEQFRECLEELGTSISDVFGAECILWVEGPTEAECFRQLSKHLLGHANDEGLAILPVKHTDDVLTSRLRETWLDIYETLTRGVGVLMPDFRFIFDSEERTEEEQAKLTSISNNKIVLLPRRMYENYILHPEAISVVLSQDLESQVSVEQISNWLTEAESQQKFKSQKMIQDDWIISVDGGRLLKELFTSYHVMYSKPRHGKRLTQWIIDNDPNFLKPLSDFLDSTIASVRRMPDCV